MSFKDRMKVAYTLLPPPLSALPAKYWTSVSLLIHSYAVGRSFEIFAGEYAKRTEDVPEPEEAFLIGFVHDLGQKLGLKRKPSSEKLIQWFRNGFESLGKKPDEIREYERYLYTNPAETRSDPMFSIGIWTLLWLADRIQGITNPIEIFGLLNEIRGDLKIDLYVRLLTVAIPQPFLRTLISKAIYKEILRYTVNGSEVMIPISTPMGVVLITENPSIEIQTDWNELIEGFEGKGLIPEKLEEDLYWNMECCENKDCYSTCGGRKKTPECNQHGFRKRDCEKGVYLDEKGNSYKIALAYYGRRKEKVSLDVVLPEDIRKMFQGIHVTGIKYAKGEYICPVCGLRTPAGVTVDFLKFFKKNITTEQWTRRLYPGNVNILMQETKNYALDPLCLGDMLVRDWIGKDVLVTLSLKVMIPLVVLDELASLMWTLHDTIGRMPEMSRLKNMLYDDNWRETLKNLVDNMHLVERRCPYDIFTLTVYIPHRNKMNRHIDEWIMDIATAGLLSSWGIYPLAISPIAPVTSNEILLTYYKGQKPLYDYRPSDRELGKFTPYVAVSMMSIANLYERKFIKGENLPAVLEILDYPPQFSTFLAQYSSLDFYSSLESISLKLIGDEV